MSGQEFLDWLKVLLPVAGPLVALAFAIVQYSGNFVTGKAQLAVSGATGLLLGFFASVAFFGFPQTVLDWFLAVVFGLVVFGGATGTYEGVKHAAKKSRE